MNDGYDFVKEYQKATSTENNMDYGYHIPIDNTLSAIARKQVGTKDELISDIDWAITMLTQFKQTALEKFKEVNKCNHEYKKATYTVQRMFLGNYIKLFSHKCKHCGHIEIYEAAQGKPEPEWVKGATEAFYNNDIFY